MANGDRVISQGAAWGDKPSRSTAAGEKRDLRATLYGDAVTAPLGKPRVQLADEGSYFVANNTTPLTAIAGIAAANGIDDTEQYFFLRNTNSDKRIYLDYLMMQVSAVGTNGTNTTYVMKADKNAQSRYTSGGSAITPANVNLAESNSAGVELYAGAVVTAAASADQRTIASGQLRSVIKVAGDQYLFDFGGDPASPSQYSTTIGTAIAHIRVPCPPVVLGPGDCWTFQINAASQTVAASFTFRLGFWER